jgi:hypothetical protein
MIRKLHPTWFFLICLALFSLGLAAAEPSLQAKIDWPITYNEQTAFTLTESIGEKTPAQRAHLASQALTSAIESEMAKKEGVDVQVQDQSATIYVRGFVVAVVYPQDAVAAGFPTLNDYSEHLKTVLQAFVSRQIAKGRMQNLFVRIFLSVFFALIAFVVIRQLKVIFDRFDHVLDEKRTSLGPVALMSETLLSGEVIGGSLAIALAIGRLVAYAAVLIAALAIIFGQFELTRHLLVKIAGSGMSQIVSSVDALLSAIPNLLVTALLVVTLLIALRGLDLFSKGLSSGRIRWRLVSGERIPLVRVFGTLVVVLVLVPLILASLFGRFHTPWETILIVLMACAGLAAVPLGAAYAVGALLVWKSALHPGDWIVVGGACGEISYIGFGEIAIIPIEGGSLTIPMLSLLVKSVHRVQRPGGFRLRLELRMAKTVNETLQVAGDLFAGKLDVEMEIAELHQDKVVVTLFTSNLRADTRRQLMQTIAGGMNSGKIDVIHCRFL